MNPRVKTVKPLKNYNLLLEFDNGELKTFDVKPYLNKGIFKELKSLALFNSVRIENGTIQWSNEADFCPDTLYLSGSEISFSH